MEASGKADSTGGGDDILGGATEASELQSTPSAGVSSGGSMATIHDVRKSFDQSLSDMQPMVKNYWDEDGTDAPRKAPETVEATEESLKAKLKEIRNSKAQKRKEDKEAKAHERMEKLAVKPPKEKSQEAITSKLKPLKKCLPCRRSSSRRSGRTSWGLCLITVSSVPGAQATQSWGKGPRCCSRPASLRGSRGRCVSFLCFYRRRK